jgi:hypothetical protein
MVGAGYRTASVCVIPRAGAILALERGRLELIRGREVERRMALGCSMLLDRCVPAGAGTRRVNIDETLAAAIITEQGRKEGSVAKIDVGSGTVGSPCRSLRQTRSKDANTLAR